MFKRNHINKTLVIAGVALASSVAVAQQTQTSTASVTVQNAFVLAESAALSFGTITANQVSGAAASSVTVNADGTTAVAGPGIRQLAAGTAAAYDVSAAAPFTNLNIRVTADSTTLTNALAAPTNPDFVVDQFSVTNGTLTNAITSAGGATFQTDATGALNIGLGATLTLPSATGDILLTDGTYEGQFTIEVSY